MTPHPGRRPPLQIALVLFAALALPPAAAFAADQRFHILVVDSYHEGFAWSASQLSGIKEALEAGLGAYALDWSIFHLDDRRNSGARAETDAYLDRLYGGGAGIDLIFTTDNSAFGFMKERPWRLAAGIPLVFAGVNDYVVDGREAELKITGIAENFQSGRIDTLQAALALLPKTRRVVFLLDATPTSQAIMNEFLDIRDPFPNLAFDFRTEEALDAQIALAAGLGPGDILIPIGTHRGAAGTLLSYEEAMEALSAACPAPSFGFIENRIDHGIVGGKILTGYDHGRSAGELGLAVLSGRAIADIPVVMANPGRLIFDYRQLARFRLDPAKLGPDALVLHRPEHPLAKYWPYLLTYSAVLAALIAIVLLLVLSRKRLKAATALLSASEEGMKRSLAEKDTLLRELYHRTKNNMYLIVSLLELGEDGISVEADKRILRDVSGRIKTMALVHEKLYRSANLTHIRFDSYLRELVGLLAEEAPNPGIEFGFELAEAELPIDKALPLGLAIYELLTNARRHAFPDGIGRVDIALEVRGAGAAGTRLALAVGDDGVGLPAGYDPKTAGSMGCQIVRSLVEYQLGGTIAWTSGPGTRCAIEIPFVRERPAGL
jgi:two-component sensor histidine kinase